MRELKFKAWDTEGKEWVDSTLFGISPNGKAMVGVERDVEDKRLLIVQYIGIKDELGREIYEGDIVKGFGFPDEPNEYHNEYQIGVAKARRTGFVIENISNQCRGGEINLWYKLKIIGNIYENPDLVDNLRKDK